MTGRGNYFGEPLYQLHAHAKIYLFFAQLIFYIKLNMKTSLSIRYLVEYTDKINYLISKSKGPVY